MSNTDTYAHTPFHKPMHGIMLYKDRQ